MSPYKAEAEVGGDGTLLLRGVPFAPGERVEVVVTPAGDSAAPYPLRGLPLRLDDPFEPAAADDWEAES